MKGRPMSQGNAHNRHSQNVRVLTANDEWFGLLGGAFSSVLFGVLLGILVAIGFLAVHQI